MHPLPCTPSKSIPVIDQSQPVDTGNYKFSMFVAFQVSPTKTRNMMSIIALLITIVLTCFSTESAAQVVCDNPIEIGELRVMKSRRCVDIAWYSGSGNVATYLCDGFDDQQIIMCGDGTIRNVKAPQNCLTAGRNGRGNVVSSPCQVFPAIPDYQKWRFGKSKIFVDNGGIEQEAREIINVKSGRYLDVANYDGHGNIGTHHRDGFDDQLFYFRSRGKLLAHGRLQNQKSGHCLDVTGCSAEPGKNVRLYNCEDELDQYFLFYENGELVNKKSRLCVDIAWYTGYGNIGVYPCEDETDQMWLRPNQYCHGDYCSFLSKKSKQCLDVAGYNARRKANVATHRCETAAPDQRFKWVNEKWTKPTATWSLVGCNKHGNVTHIISNTVSYTTSVTKSISVQSAEVSSTIEAGVIFTNAEVTESVRASLVKTWEASQPGTKDIGHIAVTCENYDSGKPFTRGCMWQLKVTTKKVPKNDLLTWKPQIVKCTSNHDEPKCPPFTKCKDEACTMCEDLPGARKETA